MLKKRHKYDDRIFESIVLSFKQYTYQDFQKFPKRQQLSIENLPKNSTLEISIELFPNDGAFGVTITQFFWQQQPYDSTIIEAMSSVYHPLPHNNPSLTYSGHCIAEFFYVLPNNQVTDDIFIRNEIAEDTLLENADWFGKTGLTESEERNLPKYIRAEYGHLLTDDDGIKAEDLTFIGCFKLNQQILKKLHWEANVSPRRIYIWHYCKDHYAYAYYTEDNILQYSLGSHYPEHALAPFKLTAP